MEEEILTLIGYLGALPQRVDPAHTSIAPGRYDEYRAIFTDAQRRLVIDALRHYDPH